MKKICVIPIGTSVQIMGTEDDSPIRGIVTSITILDGGTVRYEVGWFAGRSYCEQWFNASQIKCVDATSLRALGFYRTPSSNGQGDSALNSKEA